MTKLYKILGLLLITCSIIQIGFAQNKRTVVPNLYKNADQVKMQAWVDSVFNTMTLDERMGQLITVITYGSEPHRQEILNWVEKQHAGGIIFLKGTPEEQVNITNAAQAQSKIPLLISIDGEWGLAMRLSNTPRFPKNMMLGAIQNDSLLYYYGNEVARQCRRMGIHINYAPTMDVNSDPNNPVIGIRSYGEDPLNVTRKGIMHAKGLEDGKVLSSTKHFPGHGNTSVDSHYALPLISDNIERLKEVDLVPFKAYIDSGLSAVMVAHLNIPALDPIKQPSSLSKAIVTDFLKDELGFSGLTFTDGLAMKGVSDEKDHCVRALLAGNDILLGPINPQRQFSAIKKAVEDNVLTEEIINSKCRKILAYKFILDVTKDKIETENLIKDINIPYAEYLNRELNAKAITLLRNENDIIPVKQINKRKVAAISIGSKNGNSFHSSLKKYGDITCFNVSDGSDLLSLKNKLNEFNTLIISVHTTKGNSNTAIERVIEGKESILTFFTIPYRMSAYKTSIEKSQALVLAYEDTQYAQEYAAQSIFGGIDINARIPVSVKDLFKVGDGIDTYKTRLGYNSPEAIGLNSQILDSIEFIVNEGIEEKAFPGCQVLVAKDGVVVYSKAFGKFKYKSDDEITDEAIYDIASMTKGIATTPAVMSLYDKKKILLNNTFSQYMPQLKNTDKKAITIRDALLHESRLTAYIPYYRKAINDSTYEGTLFKRYRGGDYTIKFDDNTWVNKHFKFKEDLVSSKPKAGFNQIADHMYINKAYRDTIIQAIADSKLLNRKVYRYSCLNFMLLKEVVENITQTDLNTFLQDSFYRPLGMDRTTFNPLYKFEKDEIVPTEKDDFLRKQLLQGYVHDEGAAFMGGISGNAGLFSNANDIAKLCQMLLNKGVYGEEEYISDKTVDLFTKTRSTISRRALGFDATETRSAKSSPTSPSSPISTYGHTGFTGTCFWIDPDNNLIYIFLSNRIYPDRTHKKLMSLDIRSRIQETIYQAMEK